ncbi:MAG: hypothetical protein INR62_12625 [Rhodospirillales bacterium]|nr:hypothetical protein [Acetobacter sp.]
MASKVSPKKAPVQPVQVYTRINSLLYTLRAIAQREDQLCMLMHHLRTSGKLSPSLAAELHEILQEIPTEEYLHDVDALRATLVATDDVGRTATSGARSRAGAKRRAA